MLNSSDRNDAILTSSRVPESSSFVGMSDLSRSVARKFV